MSAGGDVFGGEEFGGADVGGTPGAPAPPPTPTPTPAPPPPTPTPVLPPLQPSSSGAQVTSIPVDLPSDRAPRMLQSLPPYFWNDPTVQRMMLLAARELDRLEWFAQNVQRGLVPLTADDTVGLLAVWESIMRLPVRPPNVSLAERQQALAASLIARRCRTTAEWTVAMNALLHGPSWVAQWGVPALGVVTVTMPTSPGSYLEGVARSIVRRLVPANYEVLFGFGTAPPTPITPPVGPPPPPAPTPGVGWVAGVSRAGDPA